MVTDEALLVTLMLGARLAVCVQRALDGGGRIFHINEAEETLEEQELCVHSEASLRLAKQ